MERSARRQEILAGGRKDIDQTAACPALGRMPYIGRNDDPVARGKREAHIGDRLGERAGFHVGRLEMRMGILGPDTAGRKLGLNHHHLRCMGQAAATCERIDRDPVAGLGRCIGRRPMIVRFAYVKNSPTVRAAPFS